MDGFAGFQFKFLQEALELIMRELDTVERTVEIDLETVDALLCSL